MEGAGERGRRGKGKLGSMSQHYQEVSRCSHMAVEVQEQQRGECYRASKSLLVS